MSPNKQPLKREFWRPETRRLLVRRQPRWGWGWGWTVNFAEVARRLRRR